MRRDSNCTDKEATNMLEPDQWDAVLSRVTGTIYRETERISSNALLNLLVVGPDPVIRQKVAKRPSFPARPCRGLDFPELGDVTMRKTWRERQRPTAAGTADGRWRNVLPPFAS
jgi:hypothetical protein